MFHPGLFASDACGNFVQEISCKLGYAYMRKMDVCCAYFDPDYENLDERIYGTR